MTFGSYSATTGVSSVYVMDLSSGAFERLAPAMDEGYQVSYGVAPISANGRYVAFVARPAADPNGAFACRVMLLDRQTQKVRRVSRESDGSKDFHRCDQVSMSADGRKVAYLEVLEYGRRRSGRHSRLRPGERAYRARGRHP